MERILVGLSDRHRAWEPFTHAVSLAKRIGAAVYVLRVRDPRKGGGATGWADDGPHDSLDEAFRTRLDQRIEMAKAEGVRIELFVADGPFEEEIIRFAQSNQITLLVAEPGVKDSLQKIRHRISCRVELVVPRKRPKPTSV